MDSKTKELVEELRKETEAPIQVVYKAVMEAKMDRKKSLVIINKKKKEKADQISANISLNISDTERYRGSKIYIDDSTYELNGNIIATKLIAQTDSLINRKEIQEFFDVLVGVIASREVFETTKILKELYNDKITVEEKLKSLLGLFGEEIIIKDIKRINCNVQHDQMCYDTYNHMDKCAAMLFYITKADLKGNKATEIGSFTKRLLTHLIIYKPLVIKEEDLLADIVKKEKDTASKTAEGKPDKVKDRIIEGAYGKFLNEACLDRQVLSGDENGKTVRQYLDEYKIDIVDFDYIT